MRGRNYSDREFGSNHSHVGFIWIENFVRIHSNAKDRINSDGIGLNFDSFNRFSSNKIGNLFWINLDEFRLVRMYVINRYKFDWFRMNVNPK